MDKVHAVKAGPVSPKSFSRAIADSTFVKDMERAPSCISSVAVSDSALAKAKLSLQTAVKQLILQLAFRNFIERDFATRLIKRLGVGHA
ncbi:hypothetical protein [Azohydromonas australica]|uniref:hypothetical protein n=1 Tax=Azohydromonas australica TaxID=364039 RepID=UPI0004242CCD|nr:hypothetical protein [Azohydromonas australica]